MTGALIATIVRIACEQAGAQRATLYLVDGDVLRPYVIHHLPKAYIEGIGTVRVGSQCCGRAVAYKKPWIVRDMLTDPLFIEGVAGALASPIRAGFSVPVFQGERVIASLACHFDKPHVPADIDIQRNEVFARLIGISLPGVLMGSSAPGPLFSWANAKQIPA